MASNRIAVEAIDHVTLVVADLEASRRFYVGLLGMKDAPRPAFSFKGAWFQAGDTFIHLILEHPESGPAGMPEPKGPTASRTHHLAFRTPDPDLAARVLSDAGVAIASGPKIRPDGAVQVFVFDPDGHLIELSSSPSDDLSF